MWLTSLGKDTRPALHLADFPNLVLGIKMVYICSHDGHLFFVKGLHHKTLKCVCDEVSKHSSALPFKREAFYLLLVQKIGVCPEYGGPKV